MDWKRRDGENEYEYVYRLGSNKDAIGTWQDIADIINKEFGYEYTECRYRKMYKAFTTMFENNRDKLVTDTGMSREIGLQKAELLKERQKLSAEKLEYNRWLREDARDELITEKLVQAIEELEPLPVPEMIPYDEGNRKEYALLFGDEHYGAEFTLHGLAGDVINKYSPEIFEERMWKLRDAVAEIAQDRGIHALHVFSMGDFCDGVLRVGQLMKLRYGVVDATVRYMEFMATWLTELSMIARVRFYMADGNHSELRFFNQPKGAFKNENMGKVIRSYIKARMEMNPNFELIDNPSGMIFTEVAGYNVLGIHGEVKNMEQAVKDISNAYRQNIDYMVCGHLHHGAYETTGVKRGVLRVPSIIGTDDFALKLNRASQPGATLVEFTEGHGKTLEYSIDLS